MTKFEYDIGVIGGGAAGLTVASGATQLGVKTLLIEREPRLGGDCLHYGCVPSKTLIKTASVYHQMHGGPAYGLPQAEVGPVEFSRIADRIRTVIETIQAHDSEERFCSLGVRVVYGEARFVDEHTVDWGAGRATAVTWVLATGSSPAAPAVPGLDQVGYLTNKDIFSLEELPESLVIMGGGPIAVEMAQAFARLGSKVTVVQRSGQILSREDADMAGVVMESLVADGVNFELNAAMREVRRTQQGVELVFERDGETLAAAGSQLLVATGRTPNVAGLGLDSLGVKSDKRGVETDRRLRTAHKHIYAAGDVLGHHQFTHAAGYEGGVVVSNAVFHLPRKVDYTWLPWCTYTGPELAGLGMTEKAAKGAGLEYTVWEEPFADNDRAVAEGRTQGRIKLLTTTKGKPLGVQIVGPRAGDLLGEWVAVVNGSVGLTTMASAVHPYPSLVEINRKVVGKVLASKIFSDKVRKTLRFIFDYKGRACAPTEGPWK